MLEFLRMIFASLGATLIIGALLFVTLLIGVLVTGMVILMAGPVVDRLLRKKESAPSPG